VCVWGVSVGEGGVGLGGGVWGFYRGCYGHSKPGFEIKFEITVFEITIFEVKPSSQKVN